MNICYFNFVILILQAHFSGQWGGGYTDQIKSFLLDLSGCLERPPGLCSLECLCTIKEILSLHQKSQNEMK